MRLLQTVEQILTDNPKARSSDKVLFVELMAHYGLKLTPVQEDKFLDMPSLESARRLRQKMQEQGKYPADPEIKKEREHKAMVMQQASPVYSPKNIERTLSKRILPWGRN